MRMSRSGGLLIALGLLAALVLGAPKEQPAPPDFLGSVRVKAAALRKGDRPPGSLEEWQSERKRLRAHMTEAWGAFPEQAVPLQAKKLGGLQREGYRLEKIIFQTLPEVWMTAHAYVPEGEGPFPAVLCVHGHHREAKQSPVVQARCIGLVKQGFFVLAVDAFGAGERGIGKKLGEYHGEMVAATLIPTGRVLAGIQVYENMRAVDYLQSRPEVDGKRLGVTGASGGGNQTMYVGAWDDRLKAVVPVCSVGNYQSYLGVACCMCEVVPGALQFMEEERVLGMVAPRALMVINGTKDSIQFSAREAAKSVAGAAPIFDVFGVRSKLRHATFEEGHGYSKAMREAMYGWMALQLKGEGDGSPIAEPALKTENAESIRCFPGDSRPDDWMTLPMFASREAKALLAKIPEPNSKEEWFQLKKNQKKAFLDGGTWTETKDGFPLDIRRSGKGGRVVVLLDSDGGASARASELGRAIRRAGHSLVTLDLRATGISAESRDRIGNALDHNTAEWSLWLGRTLLEQWVGDLRRVISATGEKEVVVIGQRQTALVALAGAAADDRIGQVLIVDGLVSVCTKKPYRSQRLGVFMPGMLKSIGDIPHLASLVAPRSLVWFGGVAGDGEALNLGGLKKHLDFARRVFAFEGGELRLHESKKADEIVQSIE